MQFAGQVGVLVVEGPGVLLGGAIGGLKQVLLVDLLWI